MCLKFQLTTRSAPETRRGSRASRNCSQIRGLPVQLKQKALSRFYLVLFEIRLAALAAYPGRNCF